MKTATGFALTSTWDARADAWYWPATNYLEQQASMKVMDALLAIELKEGTK